MKYAGVDNCDAHSMGFLVRTFQGKIAVLEFTRHPGDSHHTTTSTVTHILRCMHSETNYVYMCLHECVFITIRIVLCLQCILSFYLVITFYPISG